MAAATPAAVERRKVRGVVFDMDGKHLTVPVIDFQYMRQRAGVGPTGDILDIISGWAPEEQQRAHQAIQEVEDQALRDMQAMPGLLELCSHLDEIGVPRGLITRNRVRRLWSCPCSVHYFHEHHLLLPPFLPAISRECEFPYKPSPAALLHICATWGIAPEECIMVGDSAKDDVVCGNRCGVVPRHAICNRKGVVGVRWLHNSCLQKYLSSVVPQWSSRMQAPPWTCMPVFLTRS
ncbi:HAD-like domain-containing protein [Scenedesmus sp. NREL 46B-D3]|nr:HAD-like domain-containing protein [Scenedesmus sp. NREL 46B-D3]